MSNKTTVIHHSADFDGLFCREIAKKFLGTENVEYIGWDFADKPLPIPDGKIYILDLPVDRVFGFTYKSEDVDKNPPQHPAGLIWIDHHKSSIETHPKTIPGYRIDGVAACRLAWQWFKEMEFRRDANMEMPTLRDFKDRVVDEPLAVRLAGEYDIWDKRDPNADAFQFGLRSMDLTADIWSRLLDTSIPEALKGTGMEQTESDLICGALLENGRKLLRYQREVDASTVNHRSFIVEWEGLKFLTLTTARCNSLTFDAKDVPETGHDALMAFYYNGTGWSFSLYHAKHRKDLDLSLIASKYGGGGHRGACGFRMDKIPFLK